MPRNGSGIYSYPAGTRGSPNTTIASAKYNAYIDDAAQDANTPRPVVMGGTGGATADEAAANLGLISAKDLAGTGVVGGTATDITIATDRVYTLLSNSIYLSFKAADYSVAGGTTIALDGIDPVALRKIAASGDVDINVGDLVLGGIYQIRYDSTIAGGDGGFILINPSSAGGDNRVGIGVYSLFDLGSDYLRRDGSIHLIADYPDLAAMLPALPDGVTWSTITGGFANFAQCIFRGPSGFVAGTTDNTDSKIYTSPDGEAPWTLQATISGLVIADIAYGAGVYCAVDGNGKSSASSNLTSWTTPVLAIGSGSDGCVSVAFGAGVFLTVGTNGKASSSPDGQTWTARTTGVSTFLRKVRFINSLFGIVGNTGTFVTSPSGVGSFTVRTTGVSNDLYGVTFGNSLYVLVGDTGLIRTTPDLSTFTTRTSGTTANFRDVVYSTSGFVAVALTGIVAISGAASGTTWTLSATAVSTGFFMAAFDSTNQYKYFLVGSGSTNVLKGIRTLPTQFQTPDDGANEWIRAIP